MAQLREEPRRIFWADRWRQIWRRDIAGTLADDFGILLTQRLDLLNKRGLYTLGATP